MKVVGVIPARYGSTRLPGKPLLKIAGVPLLEHVLKGVQTSERIQEFLVATDHPEIAELAEKCGVGAVMTESSLPSGSDRVWAAVRNRGEAEIVVNVQGDEPLIEGPVLDRLVQCFDNDPELEMATLARAMTLEDLQSANTAKIVLNHRQEALYFSRLPIPYSRALAAAKELTGSLKHIGMYAYRKQFLGRFCETGPVEIELAESLEQLRALYLGARIKVACVEQESWGVDTPSDVAKVESLLRQKSEMK